METPRGESPASNLLRHFLILMFLPHRDGSVICSQDLHPGKMHQVVEEQTERQQSEEGDTSPHGSKLFCSDAHTHTHAVKLKQQDFLHCGYHHSINTFHDAFHALPHERCRHWVW